MPFCSQNPKNDHFALLVIWSNFLRSCGLNLIKLFMWVYNVDVDQKSWGLTVYWPQLTFSPIQLIFRSTVQLTGQNLIQSLKLGMRNLRGPKWSMKVTWGTGSPKIPVQTQTLISGHQCKEMSWVEQTLILSGVQRFLWGWILIKWEGKFWGTIDAPVQSSWTWRVRFASLSYVTRR